MTGTYVYGIVSAEHPALPDDLAGIGEPARTVRTVTEGPLTAVVSEAPDGLRPKRRDLLAHQKVLADAVRGGPVLPMRFGSVAPDDKAVAEVLSERSEHWLERLSALDGKVEYNVKAQHDEEALLHLLMAENAEIRALTEENRKAGGGSQEDRLRLGETVVAAVQEREARDAAELQRLLEPGAEAVAAGPGGTGGLANLSFLVDERASTPLLTAVAEVRRTRPHLELKVTGPLPPYSFVEPGPAPPAEPE
ncbi:GvpL/GvpF family gas vesicle protein [Streptomyces xanthii]|uniref:GvpL/GvpF family gas vesicle protein n=1 Tax=Streptomyces xanthii TaxID=2768069 RepID=A0A7H1B3G1_9ACTN|nr:GvpL/GvpF family gas vesicle protein [Streptomyces xanthii]QNS03266.1 GvpL/GvpF family gas vesicle protein [Streptomyces xanthii]